MNSETNLTPNTLDKEVTFKTYEAITNTIMIFNNILLKLINNKIKS